MEEFKFTIVVSGTLSSTPTCSTLVCDGDVTHVKFRRFAASIPEAVLQAMDDVESCGGVLEYVALNDHLLAATRAEIEL